jgi:dihydrofolate reductase
VPDPRDAPIDENAAMGKVIFLMNVSLDGYIETPDHSLDWTINDDELLVWFNERMRSFEAIVYGRRLYELSRPTRELTGK